MIYFVCPCCQKSLETADENGGKNFACPTCGESFRVQNVGQVPEPGDKGRIPGSPTSSEHAGGDLPEVLPADHGSPAPDAPKVVAKAPHQKYCVECGTLIRARASFCPECGVAQTEAHDRSEKYCHECGFVMRGSTAACPKCGVEQPRTGSSANGPAEGSGSNRVVAGVCGILIGSFGVHKFILGYTTAGITMLLISLLGFCFAGWTVMHIIGLIEGISYLCMTEPDFQRIHGKQTKPWF